MIPTTLGQLLASPLASGGSGALGLAFTTNSFVSLLSFLETQGTVQVLSRRASPPSTTRRRCCKVGTDDFFVTNVSTTTTTTSAGSVTTPSIQTLQPYFSGISLDVTPQIDDDSNIDPAHSPGGQRRHGEDQASSTSATLGTFTLPLAIRAASTRPTASCAFRTAVIVAIGGLMTQSAERQDRSRARRLGDVPGLGTLFGSAPAELLPSANW